MGKSHFVSNVLVNIRQQLSLNPLEGQWKLIACSNRSTLEKFGVGFFSLYQAKDNHRISMPKPIFLGLIKHLNINQNPLNQSQMEITRWGWLIKRSIGISLVGADNDWIVLKTAKKGFKKEEILVLLKDSENNPSNSASMAFTYIGFDQKLRKIKLFRS